MELKAADVAEVQQIQQHFHVLAVDDSLIDRKLLEKLLRISSCEGKHIVAHLITKIFS